MVLGIDSGGIGIIVALIAVVPGALAWLASRRATDADVFVRRDADSWTRMLDSVARSDRDRDDAETDRDRLREELADVRAHCTRCDAALADAEQRIAVLTSQVETLINRGKP